MFKYSKLMCTMLCAALVSLSLIGCGQKQIFASDTNKTVLDEDKKGRYENIEKKLDELDQVIDKYYLNEDEIDPKAMEDGIMKGYIDSLGEIYTVYYNEEEFHSMMEETAGTYHGIGMMVLQDANTKEITVIQVFDGSPAQEAGLQVGDILYKVEDEEIIGQEVNMVVAKIKGEAGTRVHMTVYRPSANEYVDLDVERHEIDVPTVEHQMLEDQMGYIKVSSFYTVTVEQFKTAIDALTSQGMKGLIIDLRNNPGGMMDSVCKILDRILPEDQLLVYTVDKNDKKEESYSVDPDTVDVPIVVLVNDQSASAAEIFTGAMKDYERATIVGTNTFGKGIVQVVVPLSDGSAVKITTSRYYTPNGVCIHGTGIQPDIEVALDPESEGDYQLEEAKKVLREKL